MGEFIPGQLVYLNLASGSKTSSDIWLILFSILVKVLGSLQALYKGNKADIRLARLLQRLAPV